MSDNKNTPALSDAAMAAAVKYVSEQMIPAAVAAAVAATTKQAPAQAPASTSVLGAPQCTECGQKLSACKGKHAKMVVFPVHYPEYFQGVFINGQKYLSNDGSHEVTVPADCVASIQAIVNGYDQNERELSTGRTKQHHSGYVSPHGSSFQEAKVGWR